MLVLGIETSCDECAAAVAQDGARVLGQVIHTQTDLHSKFGGVVPELASRKHTEMILPVVQQALDSAGVGAGDLDGVAATAQPGLTGSLLVGLSFAKAYSYALGLPFIGINHILAHIYAAHLEYDIEYPYIGLLVSGGHTMICKVSNFDSIEVMGTTIDDACGESFDKIAKYYNMGFPGGVAVDRLAQKGDPLSFRFPGPNLKHTGPYDVSYSGLKSAVINQSEQFRSQGCEATPENIAASFQRVAVNILLKRLYRAAEDTGISRIVAGGGVAANSLLRAELTGHRNLEVIFPSLALCTDNGAMVAGIGCRYLEQGRTSPFSLPATARVQGFKKSAQTSKSLSTFY